MFIIGKNSCIFIYNSTHHKINFFLIYFAYYFPMSQVCEGKMQGKSNLFDVASASMAHATKRHQIISNNIAHSDTPNYVGRDLKTFSLDNVDDYMRLKATRTTHLNISETNDPYSGLKDPIKQAAFDETINNNQISVEEEIAKATEAVAQHNFAMGIWQKSKNIMMHVIDSRR